MPIVMTAKHQITIPKRIADILHLRKGSMFNIDIHRNRIELIPLEAKELKFTDDMYKKLEVLSLKERGKEKKVTKRYIAALKKGKV